MPGTHNLSMTGKPQVFTLLYSLTYFDKKLNSNVTKWAGVRLIYRF
jgi:hypothetical protein